MQGCNFLLYTNVAKIMEWIWEACIFRLLVIWHTLVYCLLFIRVTFPNKGSRIQLNHIALNTRTYLMIQLCENYEYSQTPGFAWLLAITPFAPCPSPLEKFEIKLIQTVRSILRSLWATRLWYFNPYFPGNQIFPKESGKLNFIKIHWKMKEFAFNKVML